eukprot:CAMPEP_0113506944 /NCGR_PEP_ID=MMETSP0014_2-20120614/36187_1 /TAXON_ID=2857 /ORGANISM="Nitzschia sp." /LENGTH=1251 /DNA_ID=CAMNT_0000402491 /DNA_START=417 /DNA_END=4172 /DNA_ORIENTATION=- /assembly_acc=CAM_ASM_000159
MVSMNAPMRRRRFGGGAGSGGVNAGQSNTQPEARTKSASSSSSYGASSSLESSSSSATGNHNRSGSQELNKSSDPSTTLNQSSTGGTNSGSSSGSNTKPCHAARLVLLCCQNALRMGARTQLGLCPPGRARRELKAALRTQTSRQSRLATATRRSSGLSSSAASSAAAGGSGPQAADVGGYFGVDKMIGPNALEIYSVTEEEFLVKDNTFDADSDEEASSGDDDDLIDMDYLLNEDAPELDDEKKYAELSEPLFTPIGAESSLANSGVGALSVGGSVGKLPFNRRKIRYFDSVSAHDTMAARAYLQQELQRSKQREVLLLAKHLRTTQRRQRRQMKEQRGLPLNDNDYSDQESEEMTNRRSMTSSSISKFEHDMTPSTAASLLKESLKLNPVESIEGMAKCYDGIVAAGVALLESNLSDPTTPTAETTVSIATRPQIMAALAPLLITSLEQPSGDVILSLARLRRMCGTPRYQRRFVQRIAPSLIRPSRGAMWCLKHQNDMEPIIAAAELIFDCAFEIFSKGWYDRGQLLLADTKRAETLNTAAMQLKNLSSNSPNDMLTLDLGHNSTWRSNKYKAGKDPKGSKEPLAEWEVIAVDRQIRVSITSIVSMDWSKVVIHSREAALSASSSYHRSRQAGRQNRPNALLQPSSSGDMSPRSIASSPLSPVRPGSTRSHVSSTHAGIDGIDIGAATNNLPPSDASRARSPIPTYSSPSPISPQPPSRSNGNETESRGSASPNILPPPDHTPPRSPTPSHREAVVDAHASIPQPTSPRRASSPVSLSATREPVPISIQGVAASPVTPQLGGERDRPTLSPLSVGMITPSSDSGAPHRMSSASSVASSVTGLTHMTGLASQPSQYRMLTSTAAERKRTVAACRALRAQITRFEEAFIQLHGRPPKGAAERAPLATTYAQYREWKRAIRADAACRIQALFRGARTRWSLLRSDNPAIVRVVETAAGKRASASQTNSLANSTSLNASITIPVEIGEQRRAGSTSPSASGGIDSLSSTGDQPLAPTWGGQTGIHRRSGSVGDGLPTGSPAPRPTSSPSGSPAGSRLPVDMGRMSLSELQNRKRELKQRLKEYDMNFARRNGRMPVKAEKEPIRHLYERYNSLKNQITSMEQEARQTSTPAATQRSAAASAAMMNQRTTVTPVGSDSEDSGPGGNRTRQSHRHSSSSSAGSGTNLAQENLASLRAEKGRLHQMLRSYERDFFREHQRQVSSFADIRPVASQYRRYKEIKRSITQLQQSNGER